MTDFGGRPWWAYVRAVRDPQRRRALVALPRVASPRGRVLAGYLLRRGGTPAPVTVTTPTGPQEVHLRHPHDYATIAEVYAEEVYPVTADDLVVVDVGANVGLVSVYALTRHPGVRVHAVEPVPENQAVLEHNLAPFGERAVLHRVAVGLQSGPVSFGVEPTGRYGGIGVGTATQVQVQAVAIATLLTDVLEREGRIDVLKIDVEGLERDLLAAVPPGIAARVGRVALEWSTPDLEDLEPWRSAGFVVSGGPKTWVLERPR